jgi:hypothetical protein
VNPYSRASSADVTELWFHRARLAQRGGDASSR